MLHECEIFAASLSKNYFSSLFFFHIMHLFPFDLTVGILT